jgi:ribosomal protein S1
MRALEKDPWTVLENKVGDVVKGTVNKINHFGAFVYLNKDIHGLAHISEMSEMYPGKNIDDLIKVGGEYSWKILSIEPRDHRMGLALVDKKTEKEKPAKKEKVAKEETAEIKEAKEEKKEKAEKPAKEEKAKKAEKPAKKEKAVKEPKEKKVRKETTEKKPKTKKEKK